jgi:Zn finger protein HypA/HybF involved in hydrogenase expression
MILEKKTVITIEHPSLRCPECDQTFVSIYATKKFSSMTIRYCFCRECKTYFKTREILQKRSMIQNQSIAQNFAN